MDRKEQFEPLKTGVEEGQALTGSLILLMEAFKAFKVKFPISTYFPVLLSSDTLLTFRAVKQVKLFSRTKVPFGQLMQWVPLKDWSRGRTGLDGEL